MPRKLPADIREQVRRRADFLCEYCHTNERWQYVRFTVDHLLPTAEGGGETPENLALACFHCNRRKSDKQSSIDPVTRQTVPLFNPRAHQWREHFTWSSDGLRIVSLTDIGRATIELLELNRERILQIRAADVEVDRHPPASDLTQSLPHP